MRMLLTVKIDTEAGNRAMQDGSWNRMMQAVMEQVKPEAAYAVTLDGKRGGLMIFDLEDPAQIPSIAEPLFRVAHASVDFAPLMTMEEVQAGLEGVAGTA